MRKTLFPTIVLGLMLVGCGPQDAPAETKELKEAFTSTDRFDINRVPEEHREMVRAITEGGGGNPAAAPRTGGQ